MYMKLITALALIGLTNEHYRIDFDASYEDYKLIFCNQPDGENISIGIVNNFHAYPGIPCYLVSYSNRKGDFTVYSGTPHVEQALFNLGSILPPISRGEQ